MLPPEATRLRPPPARHGAVARHRLEERLDAAWRTPLTLVQAPAGSGKTSLIAAWTRRFPRRIAWLSLEARDDDPTRFWSGCLAALRVPLPEAGQTLESLLSAAQAVAPASLAAALAQDQVLTAAPEPIALVLDDYHVIAGARVHESLLHLVEHAPESLRLVIASRTRPPLALARLRARGQVLEMGGEDLRFGGRETERFLADTMQLHVTERERELLRARTEGWAAGLQLAALTLRTSSTAGERAKVTESLSGAHQHVRSYVWEEIVDRLDPALRRFLLETSVLHRLSAPLCDAVTGGRDSQAMLERAEHEGLFLLPLDATGEWFRYHQLFADALRAQLRRAEPSLERTLCLRASEWCAHTERWEEAVHYALAGGDAARAAALVEEQVMPTGRRGNLGLVRRWLSLLPEHTVRSRPPLALASAAVRLISGDLPGVLDYTAAAEAAAMSVSDAGEREVIQARVAALQGSATRYLGDPARAQALLEHARARLAPDDPLRPLALFAIAELRQSGGSLDEAEALYEQAKQTALHIENGPMVLVALGAIAALALRRGNLDRASAACEEGMRLAEEWRQHSTYGEANVLTARGRLRRAQGDLEAARRDLQRAIEIATPLEYRLILAYAHEALADVQAAIALSGADKRRDLPEPLTEREREVLRRLSEGLSNAEIAAQLVVSLPTVKTHVQHILGKLGASNRRQAVRVAREKQIL